MAEDAINFEIMPGLMQAARGHLAALMAGLEDKGFEGLTPAFATVIPLLDANGMHSTELARRAGVSKQAMSQLVKLLEERRYVEHVADPTDTRAKVVRLTKRGVAMRQACAQIRKDLHDTALRTLGPRGLAKFQRDLQKLNASLARTSRTRPGSTDACDS